MRISELSAETGVTIATIKYYLREGLVPAGTATASNQATYGPEHVHRLRLIRALRDVGGLGIDRVRRVLSAIDDEALSRHDLFGVASRALESDVAPQPGSTLEAALAEVDGFVERLGWRVGDDAGTRRELAQVLVALRRLGRDVPVDVFRPYADAADRLAAWEVQTIAPSEPPSVAVERMIVGTVLFERVLVTLRRMAHEHRSAQLAEERASPGAASGALP